MKGVGIEMDSTPRTKNRGFASMDAHRQREIARKGGRAAHEKGKAHEFTPDEARAAGRKGGEKVSVNRRHMAEIGRRGGRSSAQRRRPEGSDSSNANGNGAEGANMQEETMQVQQAQPVASRQPGDQADQPSQSQ
jgi:general stress protein YciG